jgi:transposase
MAKTSGNAISVKTASALPTLHPHAAGIDIGATEIFVAVPADSDPEPVRSFETFTADLNALADWLLQCHIRTVAMESTGVYWIALFQILERRGLEVCLVNARHVQNVPGRKSDVSDCQWLQYLHAVGLLRGSFRPPAEVCAIRSLLRHRETLVGMAATHVQHMHKALTQMNLQLHHVITDVTGKTGLLILDAILSGERDPQALAELRDRRIKSSKEVLVKALHGDYLPEHLFTLRQALSSWRHYQHLLSECDAEIERRLSEFDVSELPPPSETPSPPPVASEGIDLKTELHRILGVDLTKVPGLQVHSVHALFSEIGRDLSAFPTAKHFVSWLGLCPDNRISGGKILSVRTRDVKSRAARVLRLAAQSLHRSPTALGAFYRKMRAKLGAPKAITATAHKLARIVYHLLTTQQPYDESVFAQGERSHQERRLHRLQKEAAALGFTLAPHG